MARKRPPAQANMFTQGDDLPLFSGTAPRGEIEEFKPQPNLQPRLPLMPDVNFDELAAIRNRIIKPRRKKNNGTA